eukprot:13609673-Alexandrium_andersonii.AAC.1
MAVFDVSKDRRGGRDEAQRQLNRIAQTFRLDVSALSRDYNATLPIAAAAARATTSAKSNLRAWRAAIKKCSSAEELKNCLLYTSDAADDM